MPFLLNKEHRTSVQLLEIVRGEEEMLPIKSEPPHVFLYRLNVLRMFGGRIRVVQPQVAHAAGMLLGNAEIQDNRFCVTDMQIAVGLGEIA